MLKENNWYLKKKNTKGTWIHLSRLTDNWLLIFKNAHIIHFALLYFFSRALYVYLI